MMNAENLVTTVGGALVAGLVIAALLPDDLWENELTHDADVVVAAMAPGASLPQDRLQQAHNAAQAVNVPGQVAAPVQGQAAALTGLVPFERAATQPYRGTVQQIFTMGGEQGWGQIRIWLRDPTGANQEISIAPGWYLQYLGCPLTENAPVQGVAFRFDNIDPNAVLYAKEIVVNGNRCRLRNDEGFALWSNQLR